MKLFIALSLAFSASAMAQLVVLPEATIVACDVKQIIGPKTGGFRA